MADIKPAEVSAILREQLSGFRSEAELQEVGTVLQVGDGIARIYGMNGVQYGELIEFDGGMQGIALNLEEDNVGAVLLGRSSSVKEGDTVRRLGKIASVQVGDGMVGRVVDTLGQPIDGKGPITGELFEMDTTDEALCDLQIGVNSSLLNSEWHLMVIEVLSAANINIPSDSYMQTGSKKGIHTEHLGYILADMQYLPRAYPEANW